MKLLALDCSSLSASAALYEEKTLLGESFLRVPDTHSVTLLPMADALLRNARVSPRELTHLAVSVGPGSFTGLRIGISAVKGLAFERSLPCVGVSTLEAAARGLAGMDGTAIAVLDARRQQVYAALFSLRGGGISRLTADAALPVEELPRLFAGLPAPLWLVGDGADLVFRSLRDGHPSLRTVSPSRRLVRASGVAETALLHLPEAVPPDRLAPVYLRPVHALTLEERNRSRSS